ncbi:MAG TPA: T9SS type A sorting domain-containing protein [Saprospiraceae bacterium]|nr:T9SS type A sorting domain-containing protein [Saprospiraceae bacterium]
MKQFYILILVLVTFSLQAQVCTFDQSEVDSNAIISPGPFDQVENPDGGIDKPACINEEYEFKFVLFVPESVELFGVEVMIDSIRLVDGGIQGLPDGLDEETNTTNDVFYPGEADCMVITGTPTENNNIGSYELSLTVDAWIRGFGMQSFELPDPAITGPGSYTLDLRAEGQCSVNNTEELTIENQVSILSNPVTTDLNVQVEAEAYSQVSLQLISMFGQNYLDQMYQVYPGNNEISIDCRNLKQGLYFLRYKDSNKEKTIRFYVVKP